MPVSISATVTSFPVAPRSQASRAPMLLESAYIEPRSFEASHEPGPRAACLPSLVSSSPQLESMTPPDASLWSCADAPSLGAFASAGPTAIVDNSAETEYDDRCASLPRDAHRDIPPDTSFQALMPRSGDIALNRTNRRDSG